jgi:hypothetical protein
MCPLSGEAILLIRVERMDQGTSFTRGERSRNENVLRSRSQRLPVYKERK